MTYRVPEKLKKLASIFSQNGYSLYLVGGAVRDYCLGRPNHDYDFTTDAQPLETKAMFRHTIDTGIKHGTVTVLFQGESYEITTFRTEGDYGDSRHPDEVHFVRNLDEDLKRRDFTINAMAADLFTGEIIDRHQGFEDLEKGIIRAIGIPEERFREDALRMLRGCRFSAKLGFPIEEETRKAMKALAPTITKVSAERIREELWGIVKAPYPRMGLEAMRETGLMEYILPELLATYGFEQDGYHDETVYEHSLLAIEHAAEKNYPLEVKVASLFHDLGKVKTRKEGEEHYTYYGHELVSEKLVVSIMQRLKASNEERDRVALLVREHMFHYTPDWSDGAVRRFMKRVGLDMVPSLFLLRECDAAATTGNLPADKSHLELEERIRKEEEKHSALTLKDLKINGKDLGEVMPKGPLMGKVLNALLDEVLETPELNNHERLLERARQLAKELA